MHYHHVCIAALGYELPSVIVTSEDLEERLAPLYEALHLQSGQLEALTGIYERRYWDQGFPMHAGATRAGRKALDAGGVPPSDIGMLIYAGVCRDQLEPATACAVADALKLPADACIYDISNACLGILNGMLEVASAIELGHIKAGLVVSCESAQQIVDLTIARMLQKPDMATFKKCLATLTGGSGAAAVLLTHADYRAGHDLLGGIVRNAVTHHRLCTWGPDSGIPASAPQVMETDSVAVLTHGVALGLETYRAFQQKFLTDTTHPDKIICHQVGSGHQRTILQTIGIPPEKDFITYPFLGNIGTVSLPLTAAIAAEREFLRPGDLTGLFGIGSGLNCLMLGVRW